MRPLAAALLALALAAPAAPAATVTARPGEELDDAGQPYQVLLVEYAAAPGEANRLTLRREGAELRIRDDAAPLAIDGACTRVDEHEAACAHLSLRVGRLDTGDGDDTARRDPSAASLGFVVLGEGDDVAVGGGSAGGPGDDRLTGTALRGDEGNDVLTLTGQGSAVGGPGDDRVEGSPGDDELYGGSGTDDLHGGGGADRLHEALLGAEPAGVAADLYDGGDGTDVVDYTTRQDPLVVDLAAPGGVGAAGEGDRLAAVETVVAGSGDDVLAGDGAANRLIGGRGADRISGHGGDDALTGGEGEDAIGAGDGADRVDGGPGADVADGGAGDDDLDGGPGADRAFGGPGSDRVAGGPGIDLVEGGDGDDSLATARDWLRDTALCGAGADRLVAERGDAQRDCETVERAGPFELLFELDRLRGRKVLFVDGRAVRPTVFCLDEHPYDCRGTAAIRVGGRTVASGRFACTPDPDAECGGGDAYGPRLRLPRAIARRVRRRGRVAAQTVIALGPGLGRGGLAVVERIWLVDGRRG